jgi:hypothetical protein
MIFNVRQFGAMGDGLTDDTYAIRQAVLAASQRPLTDDPWGKGGIVYFPAGKYIFKGPGPLEVDGQSSLHIMGAGAMFGDERESGSPPGPRSSLYWMPDEPHVSDVLLKVLSSSVVVSDLGFYGSDDIEEPGLGTLIQFDSQTIAPAGNSCFRNVTLAGAAYGIKMGGGGGTSTGNDTTVFERISMENLDVGFHTAHLQAVGFIWSMLRAKNCRKVFDLFEGGGITDLDTAEIINCGGSGANDYPFDFGAGGPNARCSRLACIRLTGTGTTRSPKFLRISGDHRVNIESYTEAQPADGGPDPKPLVKLGPGAAATFGGSSFRNFPVAEWSGSSGAKATLRFRDCFFDLPSSDPVAPGDIIASASASNCFYSFERCDRQANTPFQDMKTASGW